MSNSTTSNNKTTYVYALSILAALGGLLFGYDTGVIAGALIFIENDFPMSSFVNGFVVSSLLLGAMVGALTAGWLSNRIGRRKVILLASLTFTVGSIIAALAPSAAILVVARVVLGLAVGLASTVVPMYISEIAPANNRGSLVALYQLAVTVGILSSYLINYAFAESGNWRMMLGIGVIPAIILLIGMFIAPESPRWLLNKGYTERARDILSKIRGTKDIDSEIDEIVSSNNQDNKELGFKELLKPWARPLLIIGIMLNFFSQASGVNVVIYYAPTILNNSGFGASAAILATIGVGVINVIMTIVGMSLVDKVGRKPLLKWGITGTITSLFILGLTFLFPDLPGASIIMVACLFVNIASIGIGVGVVLYVIPSEIFPIRIRSAAMGISTLANYGTNFIVTLTFLSLVDIIGSAFTFWLYGAISVVFLLFTYKFIPETKGSSLEEIEAKLTKSSNLSSDNLQRTVS